MMADFRIMRRWKKRQSHKKGKRNKQRRQPFRQRLLAVPIIAGSILLTTFYGNSVIFRKLEAIALGFTMRIRAPKGNSDVVIVRITRDDYKNFFGARSPLDPAKVNMIITAIASARPKVLGVDLDTSPEMFESIKASADWPPVVWARSAAYSHIQRKHILSTLLGKNSPSAEYGLTTLKLESDGTIRRYTRWYDTDAGFAPSFSWAILQKFRNTEISPPSAPDFNEEFLIDYAGPAKLNHFFSIPVSQLPGMPGQGPFGEGNVLENKMVILGGDYAVENEHDTPVGWVTASEVLATIIETEQHGGGRKPMGTFAFMLLAVIGSILLLSLIHWVGLWQTLLISVVLLPVIAVLLNLLVFGSVYHVGNLLLILSLVLLYEVYEKVKDHFKKWRQENAESVK